MASSDSTPNDNTTSSNNPNLQRRSSLKEYFNSIPIRSRLPSLRSRKSPTPSLLNQELRDHKRGASGSSSSAAGYMPYTVHQQTMQPIILRDEKATRILLEWILEMPNGRRSLSRLARTCKAFKEPVLNILWKDLDSFLPLLSLFPTHLMRRSKRPGLGLAKNPEPVDWVKLLAYAERVNSIAYVEAYNNVSPSIFATFEEHKPRQYVFPNLTSLTWKAESAATLEKSLTFINPGLRTLTIEVGSKGGKVNDYLGEVMSKTHLNAFSFTYRSSLPDKFIETLQSNNAFEKLSLMAPGGLSSKVGKWVSSLPLLRSFQLDLSHQDTAAVEGFFEDITPGSGYSTPSSLGGTDSGVFSGDEADFSDIRKAAIRLTSDSEPGRDVFPHLSQLSLTGDLSNIVTFLKYISRPLTQLDLVIEDPPQKEDWQEVCIVICDQFSDSLRSLRITATNASKFFDLVRSTTRAADIKLQHLSLENFAFLPHLLTLEIDLPESAIFHNKDITHLSRVCPNLEILRLCNLAKFNTTTGAPLLTLEGLTPLTIECKRLHTLAVVVNAAEVKDDSEVYRSTEPSSQSLLHLNVGHSWIKDPLQTAILLSHIAPRLENIKWYTQARVGSVEVHAAGWQKVSELLPHLQNVRLMERRMSEAGHASHLPQPLVPQVAPPIKEDKEVDATIPSSSKVIYAVSEYIDEASQISPELVDEEVEAHPATNEVGIDAKPSVLDVGTIIVPQGIDEEVQANILPPSRDHLTVITPRRVEVHSPVVSPSHAPSTKPTPSIFSAYVPSVGDIVSLPIRVIRIYTYYVTYPLRYVLSLAPTIPDISAMTTHAGAEKEASSTRPLVPNGRQEPQEEHTETCFTSTSSSNSNIENNLLTTISPVCQ
ncbi:hypothetical protein C8Q75DRAFT_829539 [Abortiporus biennis]|nr:hypothetical protein C8Q75DRAFT_829539 [Abortiporus biennis]